MLDRIKKLKRIIMKDDFFYKITKKIKNKKIGSDYGGWWIATDGLEKKVLTIFSFGLGEDISFDTEMLKRYNTKLYGFDPTPKSIQFVESMNLSENFSFHKYALSDQTGTLTFNLPENESYDISGSAESIPSNNQITVLCKDLNTICNELGVLEIDILKMDIEGTEYKVVENMVNNKILPNQILIEYHHFFTIFSNNDSRRSIKLLLDNGYDLFHIDGYNYSFLKK